MTSRALVFSFLLASITSAAIAQSRREPKRVGVDEMATLMRIVEEAVGAKAAGGNAWLKWAPHFLRGTDRKTYIPFTLSIDEAPGAFKTAAMYVRVAPRGDQGRSNRRAEGVQNVLGVATGDMPVGTRERGQLAGAPTVGEASMLLRSLTAKEPTGPYPYEAVYGVEPTADAGGSPAVRRALAVAPGDYDMYIAIVERDRKGEKKWAVLKEQLTVPDLSGRGLRLSSVILADRVEPLTAPLNVADQSLRPYALGSAELVPARDHELRQDETLHVAFLIYEASADGAGKPDVRVEYRLFLQNFASERLLGATAPQTLDAATLPATFDLRAGAQLAPMQSLPLNSYKPGSYRFAIRVTDNRTGTTAEENIRFVLLP